MFCRRYQYAIEKQLDDLGTVQDSALLKHLKHCARCKAFYEQLVQIEKKLRSAAVLDATDRQVENVCAAVNQRIAETDPAPSAAPVQPSAPRFRLYSGLTAAAAMLLISILGIFYFQQSRHSRIADPAAAFVNNTAAFKNRLSYVVRLPEQSIQTEMQKLTGNARSALDFLTDCIPASPVAVATDQNRNP